MEIVTTEKFNKKYKKLNSDQKSKVDVTLRKFANNPFDPSLLNHNLHGRLKGFKSIKAAFDLKIIFREENGYVLVIMINLGKHEDVY